MREVWAVRKIEVLFRHEHGRLLTVLARQVGDLWVKTEAAEATEQRCFVDGWPKIPQASFSARLGVWSLPHAIAPTRRQRSGPGRPIDCDRLRGLPYPVIERNLTRPDSR